MLTRTISAASRHDPSAVRIQPNPWLLQKRHPDRPAAVPSCVLPPAIPLSERADSLPLLRRPQPPVPEIAAQAAAYPFPVWANEHTRQKAVLPQQCTASPCDLQENEN